MTHHPDHQRRAEETLREMRESIRSFGFGWHSDMAVAFRPFAERLARAELRADENERWGSVRTTTVRS